MCFHKFLDVQSMGMDVATAANIVVGWVVGRLVGDRLCQVMSDAWVGQSMCCITTVILQCVYKVTEHGLAKEPCF